MDDRRTPMEAEVQELPLEREACVPEDFYGTAVQPRTRRDYTWVWICLCLVVILVCTFSVVASLSHVRVENGDGRWRIAMGDPEETKEEEDPVQDLSPAGENQYLPIRNTGSGSVRLRKDTGRGEALSASAVYEQGCASVVCVQVESYYGTDVCTGVVISDDGYLLSASEGLSNAVSVTVSFSDGTALSARRIGEDRTSGVCLLKVEATGLKPAVFAAEDELSVGQSIYCICNPYGARLPNVFYEGMISACRTLELGNVSYTVLQTSAQLQNVGLGCPILDSRGRVLGLTSAIGRQIVSGEDPCFAVSAGDLERIVAALEKAGAQQGSWVGLEVSDIPDDYLYLYGFPGRVWIDEVAAGTAPYGVLYQYDVILAVDGTEVSGAEEFERLIAGCSPGDRVKLTIYRNGKRYTIILPVLSR